MMKQNNFDFENENELEKSAFIELISITTPSIFSNDCLTTENSLLFMPRKRQRERNTNRKRYKQYNVHKHTTRRERVTDRIRFAVLCTPCECVCEPLCSFAVLHRYSCGLCLDKHNTLFVLKLWKKSAHKAKLMLHTTQQITNHSLPMRQFLFSLSSPTFLFSALFCMPMYSTRPE